MGCSSHFIIIWVKWMVSGYAECQSTNDYNHSPKPNKSALNILFVLVLDWKVTGIALGSVIATYLALFLALSIFYNSYAKHWACGMVERMEK